MNPNTMTLAELRKWLYDQGHIDYDTWVAGISLDALDRARPDGWGWGKAHGWLTGHKLGKPDGGPNNVRVRDTGSFLLEFARLVVAMWLAEGKG